MFAITIFAAVIRLDAFIEADWMPAFYYSLNYTIEFSLENVEISLLVLLPWNGKDYVIKTLTRVCFDDILFKSLRYIFWFILERTTSPSAEN